MRVMPTFCAMTPDRIITFLCRRGPEIRRAKLQLCKDVKRTLKFDLDIDAGSKIKLHQSVNRLRRWIDNVENALMGPHFKLFARLLIDMRRTVDREFFNSRRQRNGPAYLCSRALCRRNDFLRRAIEDSMIECL